MQIKVAKSAGFCFGVKRAVGIAESYAERGKPATILCILATKGQVASS